MSRAALRSFYFFLSAAVIALDRITKILIRRNVALDIGNIPVIPNLFSITHVENTGAAFSLFADWPRRVRVPLLVGFSTIALIVVCFVLWNTARRFTWSGVALALILGGAVGNLYDRLVYGRVTDFLHVYIGTHMWPDFNIADSAIVVGAILLGLGVIFGTKAEPQS